MLKGRLCKILAVSLAMTLAGLSLHAQDGAYTGFTPHFIFGIGDIFTQGSAYNKSMGGVGIATRNRRYINYLNPAAVTFKENIGADGSVKTVQESNGTLKLDYTGSQVVVLKGN